MGKFVVKCMKFVLKNIFVHFRTKNNTFRTNFCDIQDNQLTI